MIPSKKCRNSKSDSARGETISIASLNENFPKEHETALAAAIFAIGLKHASPKLIMPLMPKGTELNTEHIKSHLQKHRSHQSRSVDEFTEFYDKHMKEDFKRWEEKRSWDEAFAETKTNTTSGDHDSLFAVTEDQNGSEKFSVASNGSTESVELTQASALLHELDVLSRSSIGPGTNFAEERLLSQPPQDTAWQPRQSRY